MPIAIPAAEQAGWLRVRLTSWNGFDYNISNWCKSVDITYGRTSQRETSISPGTCNAVLDDTVSLFEPGNHQSPLFGYLDPLSTGTLRVDTLVEEVGQWFPLFCGGVQSLERTFTGGDYSETAGKFVDQSAELLRHVPPKGTTRPAELTGARIEGLLTGRSRSGYVWRSRAATTAMDLDTGQKMCGPVRFDGQTSTWELAQAAANAEGGLLFFDASGTLVFQGQQARLGSTVAWTLGDIG